MNDQEGDTVGEVFSDVSNLGCTKPLEMRSFLHAVSDRDRDFLERWAETEGGQIGVVVKATLGSHPMDATDARYSSASSGLSDWRKSQALVT